MTHTTATLPRGVLRWTVDTLTFFFLYSGWSDFCSQVGGDLGGGDDGGGRRKRDSSTRLLELSLGLTLFTTSRVRRS